MKSVSYIPLLSLLLLLANDVTGFAMTTASRTTASPMTMKIRSLPSFRPLTTQFRVASSASSDSTPNPVMRQLERKEAEIIKRREEALQKLDGLDKSLEVLQTKKAEYLAASQIAQTPPGGSFSETALRSAVKAFMWRVIAGLITFATTLKFSGSITSAFKVVGADFFSKSLTMFIGERLMNKSQAGRTRGADNVGRSFAKAIIWRLFAICTTLTAAIFISKDLSVASKIASTDAVFKTSLMFFYERVWARVEWGKEYLMEFTI
jgi:uncharacterized membrane protein